MAFDALADCRVHDGRGLAADAAPGLLAFVTVGLLAAANGGYDPPAWGVASALLLSVVGIAAAGWRRPQLSRAELAVLAGLAGLTLWTLASVAWSSDPAPVVLSGQRLLVYLAGTACVLVLAGRGSAASILSGALAAATATVANGLVGLLAPSLVASHGVAQTGRLGAPVGYWNGLAIMAVVGILIALGLAARTTVRSARVAALAPLPVLAVGLFLTFSRGGWLALAIGLLVMLIVETRRWQLAAVIAASAPGLALDVLVTAGSPALTHVSSPLDPATAEGHRLALLLAATLPLMAVAAVGTLALERRWAPSRRLTKAARVAAVVLGLAAVGAPMVVYGSPASVGRHLYAQFNSAAPGGFKSTRGHAGRSLNDRLFSLSGDGRVELWQAAWSDSRAHPLLGSGAGSYERWWLRHRPGTLKVRNAHSLFLETLAELGPVGLALLLLAIATPLVVAVRRRSTPFAAVAGAALAAYVVHAAIDWDFQLPAVTLLGLMCGAAVLSAARPEAPPRFGGRWRWAAVAVCGLLVVAALAGLRGDVALSRSQAAAAQGNWALAASQARTAHSWQPWSDQPWIALGNAELGPGRYAAAAAAFRRAARIAPGDWTAWFGLARAATGGERRAALAKALALDPHEPVVDLLARASGLPARTS
jgi:hypothetical protein